MLKLWCKALVSNKTRKEKTVSSENPDLNEAYIECLQKVCREFDISMPLWHTKHTKQLGLFRKITFLKDDFMDPIPYDRITVEVLIAE